MSVADRCKLSDNQVVSLVSVIVKSSGSNLDDLVLSTSSCRRARNLLWTEISQEVKDYLLRKNQTILQFIGMGKDSVMKID